MKTKRASLAMLLGLLIALAASPALATPCGPVDHTLGCAEWFGVDTDSGTATMDSYPGFARADALPEDGPEIVVSFTAPPATTTIDVNAVTPWADVDVFVLYPSCDSNDVGDGATVVGQVTDTIFDYAVTPGQTYYLILDAPAAYGGPVNLVVNCDHAGYEICHDLADNDGDGLVDCDDPECTLDWECAHPAEVCMDGIDNNNDGLVDCADPTCANHPTCGEQDCYNGLDDDGDGFIDCADANCSIFTHCMEQFNCSDGVDNDVDFLTDCDDPDCGYACGTPESCNNGIDDDLDGDIDCADHDCDCHPSCNNEICTDGVDNDGDGIIDCDDCACFCDYSCPNECGQCTDNVDNDGDGPVDCEDIECLLFDPACGQLVETCDDYYDNDNDGLVDCCDPDCSNSGWCLAEAVCNNGWDEDCDGDTDCADSDCAGDPYCAGDDDSGDDDGADDDTSDDDGADDDGADDDGGDDDADDDGADDDGSDDDTSEDDDQHLDDDDSGCACSATPRTAARGLAALGLAGLALAWRRRRGALLLVVAVSLVAVGCPAPPAPEPPAPVTSEAPASGDLAEGFSFGDVAAARQMAEGDEITLEIAGAPSANIYQRGDPVAYTYRLVNGQLVPLDGGPALPDASSPVMPLGLDTHGGDAPAVTRDAADHGDLAAVLRDPPPQAQRTLATEVDRTARLATHEYLDDLTRHGVAVEYTPVRPPPTGATEVVEMMLDGQTRAAVEQFDDPVDLAVWVQANRQLMTDHGMDPDQHLVVRGMTVIRFGPSGHAVARTRAQQVDLTPIVLEE